MRSPVSRWGVAIVLVAAAGCSGMQQQQAAKPAVDLTAVSGALDSANTAWQGAVTAKDTTVMGNLYAEDAHQLPPNGKRVDGRDAIRHVWAGAFAMPGFELKTASNTHMISEAGDQAVDLGSYEFAGTTPKGKPWHDTGKYVTVFKKEGGAWKIAVETWNSDLPVPGM